MAGLPGNGAAYVFREPRAGWRDATQDLELAPLDTPTVNAYPLSRDLFGSAVATDGRTTVIGGPGHGVLTNPDQGAAWVFGPLVRPLSALPRKLGALGAVLSQLAPTLRNPLPPHLTLNL